MLSLAIYLHRKSFNTQKINPGPPLLSISYFQIARMTDATLKCYTYYTSANIVNARERPVMQQHLVNNISNL